MMKSKRFCQMVHGNYILFIFSLDIKFTLLIFSFLLFAFYHRNQEEFIESLETEMKKTMPKIILTAVADDRKSLI